MLSSLRAFFDEMRGAGPPREFAPDDYRIAAVALLIDYTVTVAVQSAAGTDALAKGVRDASRKLVAGMQPDGPLATGSLKEKQHLQTDVTLAPGKCYAIVGFSPKVKDFLTPHFERIDHDMEWWNVPPAQLWWFRKD